MARRSFVGVFLARISRGRTLRECVIAAITTPVLCDFIIVAFFCNSAPRRCVRSCSSWVVRSDRRSPTWPPSAAIRRDRARPADPIDVAIGSQ
ncbi:MAG: BCCT family transporter [Brevundimonas sp.]